MTCDNLLCTRQNICAFPLQCLLDYPKTIADVSTNPTAVSGKCIRGCFCNGTDNDCINDNNAKDCVFYRPINVDMMPPKRTPTDRDLVAKIEGAKVLRAEDLNELVRRFKEYAKLT